jgi:hypothetical protein
MDGQETTIAVTGHWQTKLGEYSLVLLDILSLRKGGEWKKTGFIFDVNSIAKMLMCAAALTFTTLQFKRL